MDRGWRSGDTLFAERRRGDRRLANPPCRPAAGLPAYFPLGQFVFAKGQFVTLPKQFEFPNPLSEPDKPQEKSDTAAEPDGEPRAGAAGA